jgi:hypothetical protein
LHELWLLLAAKNIKSCIIYRTIEESCRTPARPDGYMLPTQESKPRLSISKIASFFFSFPSNLRWIFLVLLLLFIFSASGLLLLKNYTGLMQTNSSSQTNCSTFLREGNILTWKIKNHGRLGNVGTLKIRNVDSGTGEWVGDQINKTKNNIRTAMTGTLNGSTMSLLHPSGAERWLGICKSRKIEGSIETTYDSQLTFEMQ